jgi:uncharacterized protein YqjF (DUF2071 family)
VRYGGRAGVWFFSLDASSWLAVSVAHGAVGLPYFHARMREDRAGDEVSYESARIQPREPVAEFKARYRPTGAIYLADAGSLDFWLTERYALFSRLNRKLVRLDIEHARWPLQHATADIERNTLVSAAGMTLPPDAPHVRFARDLHVLAHWPVSV